MWFATLALVAAAADPSRALVAQMHDRYEVLAKIRDEVAQGRLDGAKAAADTLAAFDAPERLPEGWLAWIAAVDASATAVMGAPDLVSAARATAMVAAACAGCHEEASGGPDLDRGRSIPPQEWEAGHNMRLHVWALEWMWLGLVANDDEAWDRGANEIVRQPMELMFERAPPKGGRTQLEQLVYVAAGRALEVKGAKDRAEVYGELLATCAQCHVGRSKPPGP